LLSGISTPLADYYPSLSPTPRPRHDAYLHFRAFGLEQAVQTAHVEPLSIAAGDAADLLPQILPAIPSEAAACVYHSYTLNQCPALTRESVLKCLEDFARERELFRVSLKWYSGQNLPHLELFTYRGGIMESELLAYCESHGRTIEWLQS
jgi:hypothetical protein